MSDIGKVTTLLNTVFIEMGHRIQLVAERYAENRK